MVDLASYHPRARQRHQFTIRTSYGFRAFDLAACRLLRKEIAVLVRFHVKPSDRSCETASEFDPQNWWTKWGDILGVAQSPKIQSIKGDKRNGHVAFGTFVGI